MSGTENLRKLLEEAKGLKELTPEEILIEAYCDLHSFPDDGGEVEKDAKRYVAAIKASVLREFLMKLSLTSSGKWIYRDAVLRDLESAARFIERAAK